MFSKPLRSIAAVIVTLSVMAAAAPASAQMMGHMHRGGLMGPLPIMVRAANLTENQKKEVHQIFEDCRSKMKPQWRELMAARREIADKYVAPGKVSSSDFSSELAKIAKAQSEMDQQRLDAAIKIRNVLTPAQLKKIAEVKTQLDEMHAKMRALLGHSGGPKSAD